VAVEDEVDGKHDWPEVVHDSYPAQMLVGEQLEALALGQLVPASLVSRSFIHG
jgi:hypothetical protein